MLLAAANSSTSTPIWILVLVPLATIAAAVIAAVVATRNAKKGPHENLKALVDIRAELAKGDKPREHSLDADGVIDDAIKRELNRLNELNLARAQGFWSYIRVSLKTYVEFQGSAEGKRTEIRAQAASLLVAVIVIVMTFILNR